MRVYSQNVGCALLNTLSNHMSKQGSNFDPNYADLTKSYNVSQYQYSIIRNRNINLIIHIISNAFNYRSWAVGPVCNVPLSAQQLHHIRHKVSIKSDLFIFHIFPIMKMFHGDIRVDHSTYIRWLLRYS